MINVIVKNGIAVHATNDSILLPNSDHMIEFIEIISNKTVRVGGGDININNSVLYNGVILPNDYEGGKYLYDSNTWSLNPNYG